MQLVTVFLHVLHGAVHETQDMFIGFSINGDGHEDTHVLTDGLK